MLNRYDHPFWPIRSSEPSFDMTLSTASSAVALATTERVWQGPSGRSVRISESSGIDYRVQFGSSTVVVTSSASMLLLGGVVELFRITPDDTYIAIMTTSTSVSAVSITLGYGR